MEPRNWGDIIAQTPKSSVATLVGPISQNGHSGLVYQRVYEWADYPAEAPLEKYKDDPNDPEEPEKERPVRWWTPRSIGFRAKILVNPLSGELRVQSRKFAAWVTGQIEEGEYLEEIAARVVAWEFVVINDTTGERTEVEPPATGGWERFLDLPPDAYNWLTSEVRSAHLPKAPAPGSNSGKRAGSTDDPTPTPSSPEPEPPAS